MQGSAGFRRGLFISSCPAWSHYGSTQGCRKTEVYRPQVWWGDNGARWVERESPRADLPDQWDQWDQLRHFFSRDCLTIHFKMGSTLQSAGRQAVRYNSALLLSTYIKTGTNHYCRISAREGSTYHMRNVSKFFKCCPFYNQITWLTVGKPF